MNGKHLSYTDRLTIEKMYNSGAAYRAIGERLGRAVSGIWREVQRGLYDHLDGETWQTVRRYSAQIAQDAADFAASSKGRSIKLGKRYDYAEEICIRIKQGESPDSICGDKKNKNEWTVSTTTLYRYIDNGYIPGITNKDLIEKPYRKRRYRKLKIQKRISPGTSIESRPLEVTNRNNFGHWEIDCVTGKSSGKGQSILVLTERLTRFELIYKLTQKTQNEVNYKLKCIFQNNQHLFKSLTCDNGSEFMLLHTLSIPVYYCHAYSAYERGSNENVNRIIRRYFPKGQSLQNVTQADCDRVAQSINGIHRKIHNYASAADMFQKYTGMRSLSY